MQLYNTFRSNPQEDSFNLAAQSLVSLCSLKGTVFESQDQQRSYLHTLVSTVFQILFSYVTVVVLRFKLFRSQSASATEITKVSSMINTLAVNFPPELFVSWSNNTGSFFEHLFNLTRQLLQVVSDPKSGFDHDTRESYLTAFNDLLNAWVIFGRTKPNHRYLHEAGAPLTPYGTNPVIPEEPLRNFGGGIFEAYVQARLAVSHQELADEDLDLDDAPDDEVRCHFCGKSLTSIPGHLRRRVGVRVSFGEAQPGYVYCRA